MKKRLYDFSVTNAIIVLSAYTFMLGLSLYSVFEGGGFAWIPFLISVFLILSLMSVIWLYVFLAIKVTENGIFHGKVFIRRKNIRWTVEDNRRFRQTEIIITDRNVNYDKLSEKEVRKKRIVVQYFPKYEAFLKEYCANNYQKEENSEKE